MYEVQKQDKLDSVLITDIYINHVGKQGNCKHRLQDGAEARYVGAAGTVNTVVLFFTLIYTPTLFRIYAIF